MSSHRIVFFHPDLGIGGAERLVIDAAVGLQNRGHKVTIFTSHCDPGHCFDEARDGTLDVRVRGNTLFPPSILGRFAIICAILRQLHLTLQITVSSELDQLRPDVFFVDQLSAIIPTLRIRYKNAKVLFYCHFPDKLLAPRQSLIKRLYRVPFDWLEGWTTGISDVIVVNSKFTKDVFKQAFPFSSGRTPSVVYPCVDTGEEQEGNGVSDGEKLWPTKKIILSINRFERKKDVGLAIWAFAGLSPEQRAGGRLVIAGGYDLRVAENVGYHQELEKLSEKLELKFWTAKNLVTALSIPNDVDVLFLLSVPSSLKSTLLHAASLVVYTPGMEHFGIVPLEAMLAGVPVLAADTGGPTETVVDGQTGWLRSVEEPQKWTQVMQMVLSTNYSKRLKAMGARGRVRVMSQFSKDIMAKALEQELDIMSKQKARPSLWPPRGFIAVSVLCLTIGCCIAWVLH